MFAKFNGLRAATIGAIFADRLTVTGTVTARHEGESLPAVTSKRKDPKPVEPVALRPGMPAYEWNATIDAWKWYRRDLKAWEARQREAGEAV